MILSIDPGINNCGISIIDLSEQFKVLDTILINNARKFTPEEKLSELRIGSRGVKVMCIINKLQELIDDNDISMIVVEAPFYSALTPAAYGSLLEVISAIKYRLIIDSSLEFKLVEPLLVKKTFASQAQASKPTMKESLIRRTGNKEISLSKNIDSLSEHEIDSIAVGFTHFVQLRG